MEEFYKYVRTYDTKMIIKCAINDKTIKEWYIECESGKVYRVEYETDKQTNTRLETRRELVLDIS